MKAVLMAFVMTIRLSSGIRVPSCFPLLLTVLTVRALKELIAKLEQQSLRKELAPQSAASVLSTTASLDFWCFTSPVKYGRFFDIGGPCPGRRIFAAVP